MLVYDSHCHIEAITPNNNTNGIVLLNSVKLTNIADLLVLRTNNNYKIGFGLHPWYIEDNISPQTYLTELSLAIKQHQPDFIGEIGLDYCKPHRELQQELFIGQLILATQYNLPVTIHCVRAYADLCNILHKYCRQNLKMRGIIHAFNASLPIASQLVKLNFLLGIGGLLNHNTKINKILADVPMADIMYNIVLESDAPFMRYLGRADSSTCFLYAQLLASRWNINLLDIVNVSNANITTLLTKIDK
jgi:TatD DNase family protein